MHPVLKEISRNLKRHRGSAPWHEPQREPEQGEIRGFRWDLPNGRKLTLVRGETGLIEVTQEGPGLPDDKPTSYALAPDELVAMRALYQWVAGAE